MSVDHACINIINSVVRIEGGYVDDPLDSGGATNYGITQRVARAAGYDGDMRQLTKADATDIYRTLYWSPLRLDDVVILSEELAHEIFDTAVNMGTGRAGRFLQNWLNAFNDRQSHYADITVDGDVGAATIGALGAFSNTRGRDGLSVLTKALNASQGAFYLKLSQTREKDERFIYGWLKNRV